MLLLVPENFCPNTLEHARNTFPNSFLNCINQLLQIEISVFRMLLICKEAFTFIINMISFHSHHKHYFFKYNIITNISFKSHLKYFFSMIASENVSFFTKST